MVGPIGCRQAVRDIATEMLVHRRDAIADAAQQATSHTYTEIAIGAAVESAVVSLEWSFWQYHGVDECSSVPLVSASDDVVFAFLESISPVTDCDDEQVDAVQAVLLPGLLPARVPRRRRTSTSRRTCSTPRRTTRTSCRPRSRAYDSAAMRDIDDYVEHRGEHLLFIYGEWDPWTGGKFALGDATDAALLIAAPWARTPRGSPTSSSRDRQDGVRQARGVDRRRSAWRRGCDSAAVRSRRPAADPTGARSRPAQRQNNLSSAA